MLLEVKKLRKLFGKTVAVKDLSFEVEAGSICAFVGPNGAGKTTTMRIIATVESPDRGNVYIKGISAVLYPEKVKNYFGFMPDYTTAIPDLTVAEYLDFYACAYGLKGREKKRRLEEIADFLKLKSFLDRSATGLSRGMSQRLGLARTLIHDPELLVLDEPAAGLDPRARVELRELLKVLRDRGKGILVSSHVLTELSEIADSVVIIEKGVLRAKGPLEEIMTRVGGTKRVRVSVLDGDEKVVRFLAEQPEVEKVLSQGKEIVLDFRGGRAEKAALLKRLLEAGHKVTDFHEEKTDLEDLFLKVTDGALQ